MKSLIVFVFSFFTFSTAMASDNLLRHVLATAQSMSALYMEGLSEGNEKYRQEFLQYQLEAKSSLRRYADENGESSGELTQQWQKISPKLKLVYSRDEGWTLDFHTRFGFRSYLSRVYQLVEKNQSSYSSKNKQLLLAVVKLESMVARFFDLSSSVNGSFSLTLSDANQLDPKKISAQFKQILDQLTQESQYPSNKQLLRAKQKWLFIEQGVINFSQKSPNFIVYATKQSIRKTLLASSKKLHASQ